MNRFASLLTVLTGLLVPSVGVTDDALEREASWQIYDVSEMLQKLRGSLDQLAVIPDQMDGVSERFVDAIEKTDEDPLDAYIQAVRELVPEVNEIAVRAAESVIDAGASIDPNTPGYGALESLPTSMRMTVRAWLGRALVRERLYDEALPVIAEVEPTESIDPAAVLFYRGACYHALLLKKEALADLRRLLENEADCPTRFVRTAQMMIADIKPLKEDTLDEISRLMTDVTRRLDLGRTDEEVKQQEQKIIDKLTKLIEKAEQQKQQQQQQQQQQSGGGGQDSGGGQSSPMQDSQIAGGIGGEGDVDPKKFDDRDAWGNLPPAERQQALQQISRDLPTHYREAIEAYFRKIATDK